MMILKRFISVLALLAVAACGGGGSGASGQPPFGGPGSGGGTGGGSGGGTGGGGTTTPTVTMELRLIDAAGQTTSSVLAGQPVRAQAVVKRDGSTVADEIVQFGVEQPVELVKIDPTAGSQLTDTAGTAIVTVSSLGANSGAGRVSATATVSGVTATASANFFASSSTATQPATLTLGALAINSLAVSAYGTTGASVQVLQNGAPYTGSAVTVNFTTSCATGKASITPNATTQPNGTAVATFVDNGCAQTADSQITITASIATDSKSGTMTVRSPTTGSLRFVSVVPSDKSITLRGQGGNGRQENATVTFKLVDVAGQGVADADVCFDISTYVGGLNIDGYSSSKLPSPQGSSALCGSDQLSVVKYVKRTNPDGSVSVQVNSGTVPTPVRVRARALYPATATATLESFSDTLSVSTGLPLQRSFSLSVNQANIDGGNFDGETATLTVRLADQFSNPVPDGTVVNFIGSGAAVCTADNGSCRTTNGACSCNVVSQARRPLDNRVVITAYAVGLEDYDDNDGDNVYTAFPNATAPQKCSDPARNLSKDCFYDLGDAFVDANKDGLSTAATINSDTDALISYQTPGQFKAAGDGTRGTAHIRASTVIYLSQASSAGDATVVVPLASLRQERNLITGGLSTPFIRLQPSCPQGTPLPQATISVALDDGIGNPMAATTSLAAVEPSDNVSTGGFRPSAVLATGARAPVPSIDLPNVPKVLPWTTFDDNNNVVTGHGVTVRGVQDKCSGDASFALEVKSPRGGAATARVLYEGESRAVSRFGFDVRYRDSAVTFTLQGPTASRVEITAAGFVGAVGGPATAYTIDWGDGTSASGATSAIAQGNRAHTYAAAGTYILTLGATVDGTVYTGTKSVVVP